MLLVAPCRVLWCCCRSVAILLLELLLLTTAYMQQCCWLSMSIGGSGGTAVRNKKRRSRGRPPWFGGACLLWPPFVASPQLAVLPYGTYDNQVLCALVYVFCVGAVFFCDRLSFLTCVVYGVRHQSYFFVSPPPPPGGPCRIRHDGFANSFFEQVVRKHFTSKHVQVLEGSSRFLGLGK